MLTDLNGSRHATKVKHAVLPFGKVVETALTPIREGVFSWSTPDPADDWMMVGHLFVRETGVVFVDPPMVPGLPRSGGQIGPARGSGADRAESHESVEIHSEEGVHPGVPT